MKTFYFYDYETFGLSPKTSRIAQFAGIRTDENLNILSENMFYCKPTNDCLPSPEACNVTNITPQLCEKKGLIEHKFVGRINELFSTPDTCIVGYNSIRFDDEFTRYTLYRNFIDPYAWHYKNNNTRWDILDVARMCYALKKNTSLKWAYDDNGKPSFKLDRLAPANNIEHSDAHDALADVRATIAIAKIIKNTQPGLFDYAFSLRNKKEVDKKIKLFEPMLHTSGMYPADQSCTRLAVALAYHPQYNERAIVFNLDQDPSMFLDLEVKELKKLMFTKQVDLPDGVKRLQLKELIFNKSPMFVSNVYKIEPKIVEQLQINTSAAMKYLDFINKNQDKIQKIVQQIYEGDKEIPKTTDVDQALYDGFIDNIDRKICNQIQNLEAIELKDFHPRFKDKRLTKLLLHFKARNYPSALTEDEEKDWLETVHNRVQTGENGYLSIEEYTKSLSDMRKQFPEKEQLWQQLEVYTESFLQV